MTHCIANIDGRQVEVFDTKLGAEHWLKRNKQDCMVLVRGKSWFQRKDGSEMTVRLNATDDPATRHIFQAANAIADEIEAQLMPDRAA